jgi:sigma-E factor negative regulatory protein RseB
MRFIHAYADGQERSRLVHLNGPAREVIRENDTVVAYFAESKPVMLDKSGSGLFARELLNDLSLIVDSYQLKMGPVLRIAGREARQVTLLSPDGERYGYRLFIDADTGLLLRSELLSEAARVIEQWQVVSLNLQSPVPARELAVGFEVNAASGVRVLPASVTRDDSAAEWIVGWLPSGFKLKSYQTQHQNADDFPIQHLLFSDGVAAISVYVAKTPEGIRAAERVWRRGAMTIVEVADAAARITVVGDIPSQTAKKIAQSVRKTSALQP